jgi:anti-sigma B factor antagonist
MSVDQRVFDPTAEFEVRVEPARDVVCVKPRGELDLATAPVLREQVTELVAVGFDHLVIDLRGLSFMDATGVRLLVWLTDQARSDGWQLSLIDGPDQVQRILALTGCTDRLPFGEDR